VGSARILLRLGRDADDDKQDGLSTRTGNTPKRPRLQPLWTIAAGISVASSLVMIAALVVVCAAMGVDLHPTQAGTSAAPLGLLLLMIVVAVHAGLLALLWRVLLGPLRKMAAAFRSSDLRKIGEAAERTPVAELHAIVVSFVALMREEQEQSERLRLDADRLAALVDRRTDELRQRERALVQQDKLASLGKLSAGIAHEINNPAGYVASNLATLGEYYEEFVRLRPVVGSILEACESEDYGRARSAVATFAEMSRATDLSFVAADSIEVIHACQRGMERIKEIVQGLRTFAGASDTANEPVQIRTCVEEAIRIVHNELKYEYNLALDLADLPEIRAGHGPLVQVFVNLLVNAIDATPPGGTISVRLDRLDDDESRVRIADTGEGMDEVTLQRIFDPFFTTKAAGHGTGLGLSIAHSIVEKCGGRIEVESSPGTGTTFELVFRSDGARDAEGEEMMELEDA